MKRLAAVLTTASLLAVAFAATAHAAEPQNFAIESATAELSTNEAGAHPDFTTEIEFATDPASAADPKGLRLPYAGLRDLKIDLPPGLVANLNAVDTCSSLQFAQTGIVDGAHCPFGSQIGVSNISAYALGLNFTASIYNLETTGTEVARLGLTVFGAPTFIRIHLRSGSDYGATAEVTGVTAVQPVVSVKTTIWGVPADEGHDNLRLTPEETKDGSTNSPPRSAGHNPMPFLVNPTACGEEIAIGFEARSYQEPPAEPSTTEPSLGQITNCGKLDFSPDLSLKPTTEAAETGSGLDADLSFPGEGFEHTNLLGEAAQKRVEVTLPKGLTVNPSQAEGLGVCTEADFSRETAAGIPNEGCPETSKVGSVTARSPLLDETAEGSLYVAKPYQNPFDSLIAVYMVLRIPNRGVVVKLPGRVQLDQATGQLKTVFGEDPSVIPQIPVSSFELHFREGARSPLVTPPACGTYTGAASFTAYSEQVVSTNPAFEIATGINHGPCPSGGLPPLHPGLLAGSINNAAGRYTPFNLRLTREDGEQEITHFSVKLPPGIVGKLAGVPFCPDAAIAAAEARTGPLGGHEELTDPSCPAASAVGRTLVGAGVGQVLTYVPGKVYLAGPYHGSALSIAAVTAGVAGPFDIGTVVVREGLKVNPETAEVFIDATGSDPIPHIINGIPVRLRDIRAYVDRPEFTINPTSCEPTSTASTVLGAGLDFVSEADDNPITVTSPFQAADCASLGFKPKLSLKLRGGTKRGGHPALRAVLIPRPGDANASRASVQLPHSEFLDQGHIRTVCTRVQFKAGAGNGAECPAGSIYGHAIAFSPILADPLQGPVILRSSEHPLPDLVLAVHGLIDFNAIGRIDSVKGGIRNTFDFIPDAPISKVVVDLQGGKKGLLENSTDLCLAKHRAIVTFDAHNGRSRDFKPVLKAQCKKQKRRAP